MAVQQISIGKSDEENNRKRLAPYIYTFLYTAGVLAILFLWKLSKPIEVEEGEGLLVDFGYTDAGLGSEEPSKDNEMNQVVIPSPGDPPFTQEVKEKVLVQDEEITEKIETPTEIKKQKIVVVENMLKNPVKAAKVNPNAIKTNQQPQEQKKVNENALFKGGFKGTGTNGESQGDKAGQGNMGDPSGSKSDNYLGKSTGLGSSGDGRGMIGKGLKGRKFVSMPKIVDNSNKTGKIAIVVLVDSDGKVISATYTPQGSTITDTELQNKCESTCKKARFTANSERESDKGIIIFTFDLTP